MIRKYIIVADDSIKGFDEGIAQLEREWDAEEIEPCNDCISRQAVLDMMQMRMSDKELYMAVYDLSPVTPQPKIGHWIMTGDYHASAFGNIEYVKCSCCREYSLEEGNYCSNCGAKMQEDEGKMRNIAEIIEDDKNGKQLSQTERQIAVAYIQGKYDAIRELKLSNNSNTNEILDKIRAEIIELRSRQNVGVLECLDIIDKYKARK